MSVSAFEGRIDRRDRSGVSATAYCVYLEVVKTMRIPQFVFVTLVLPTLLFAMFGLSSAGQQFGGVTAGQYMMASFGTYAVMSVALFSFGVSIASERAMGWLRLLRATALPPLTFIVAKIAMALLFGFATVGVLYLFGGFVGRINFTLEQWGQLAGMLVLGMTPFVALGLWLGLTAGPSTAAALANLIYLPLSFASGLFVPLPGLPHVVQLVAPYLPSYHLAQLGWTMIGAGDGLSIGQHFLWLLGYTVVFLGLARVAYRRDEGANFG